MGKKDFGKSQWHSWQAWITRKSVDCLIWRQRKTIYNAQRSHVCLEEGYSDWCCHRPHLFEYQQHRTPSSGRDFALWVHACHDPWLLSRIKLIYTTALVRVDASRLNVLHADSGPVFAHRVTPRVERALNQSVGLVDMEESLEIFDLNLAEAMRVHLYAHGLQVVVTDVQSIEEQ